MALGNTAINEMDNYLFQIDTIVKGQMENSWNTFQYVAKNLQVWADETTVGKDLIDNLIKTTDDLKLILDNTKSLTNSLEEFIDNQKNINNI